MGNRLEALLGTRVSRGALIEGGIKVVKGVAGLALASTIPGCPRPKESSSPPTPSVVAPGIKFLDDGAQGLGEKARELAGMRSPTPAQLKANKESQRPTIAVPEKPAEAQKPVEKLQNIELKLAADVPAGTAISPKSIQIARDMIEKRVAESRLEGSAKVDSQNRIIININGASNPGEAVETVSQTGLLEFVTTGSTYLQPGTFITTSEGAPRGTTPVDKNTYQTILQNRHFKDASVSFDQNNRPLLQLLFTEGGTQIFSQYTQNHVGQWLGIAMDKRVLSSLVIRSAFSGSNVLIEGDFTPEELQKFVAQIKHGPLPLPFKVVESILVKPAEAPKPAPEPQKPVEKQEVQSVIEQLKKLEPEELQRTLLTNPFSQDKLPKGFAVESGPTPSLALAPNLYGITAIDNLAVPFKPIGKVSFGLKDGKKSYNISYTVFPKSNAAKGAFDSISSQPNVRSIKDFYAPAVLNTTRQDYTIPMAILETVITVSSGSTGVEYIILLNNLLVNISSNETYTFQSRAENLKSKEAMDKELAAQKQQIEQQIQKITTIHESAIIPVVKAGVGHLQKITG